MILVFPKLAENRGTTRTTKGEGVNENRQKSM